MTLYDALGVARTASDEEIKAAYKAKAKITHPDAGGNADDFQTIQAAYEILSDPALRAQYDIDGIVAPGQADQGRRDALKIIDGLLAGLIQEVVNSDNDPHYSIDAVTQMRGLVNAHMADVTKQRDKIAKGVVRLSKLAERFSVVEGKDNLLAKMVDSRLGGMQHMIEQIEKDIALHNEVINILKDFTFRWDQNTQWSPGGVYPLNQFSQAHL